MTDNRKSPGDRLVLGMLSVLRTLVVELSKKGVLDANEFVQIVQETAIAHREAGDPAISLMQFTPPVCKCAIRFQIRMSREKELRNLMLPL
jgi:hypothetical protein